MERGSPTRLFTTVSGAFLVLLGLAGFLAGSEFDRADLTSDLFGLYPVNGWANALHILTGLIALAMARSLARVWSMVAAAMFLGLALWGILAPPGDLLLGVLPATRSVNALNLAIGLLGLISLAGDRVVAAGVGSGRRRRGGRGRRSREGRLRGRSSTAARRAFPEAPGGGDSSA